MKILFCGDIFSNYESRTSFRSGIFFVACALLKEFCRMDDIHVTVYCSLDRKHAVEHFLQDNRLNIDVVTVRPLAHRRFRNWFETQNFKRNKKELRPLKGAGKLGRASEWLDRRSVRGDMKCFTVYDAWFSPCESVPYAVEKTGIPIYTVIHDLIPIVTGEFPVRKGYWLYDVLNQVSPEKYYFCISECTRRDFLHCCPKANPEHVKVIYNGYEPKAGNISDEEAFQITKNAGLTWGRYILILGNVVPHKNTVKQISAGVRFIRESGIEDFRIAVVGSCSQPEEILLKAEISAEDCRYISFCGYVPDEHIRAYYRGAFCLSFTSLYEGFGLPALEAMDESCPVVTSNTSAFPEIVGDAALCIPPEDADAHVKAYSDLYTHLELREKLIVRGKKRVKLYCWNHTAQQMVEEMKNGREI